MNASELTWQIETDPVLGLILNSITDQAVFTLDPDGFITTWNEGCRRIKRYTYEEAIGEYFGMLYTPEDQEQGRPAYNLQVAFETGEHHEEWARVRKGGERYIANVSIYRLEKEGQHVGFAKVVRDVSVQRRLEQSSQELQGLYDLIARRLIDPVRAIVEDGRLLQEGAGSLPPETRAKLDSLVHNVQGLGRLGDDLRAFAQQEVDAGELARRLAAE